MALNFVAPSMRAAGSDLTISISPLGLVELSDEEFEVHGPRLTRYANAAAFYLGHHWAFLRPPGEPQITANYVEAFSDWMTNFSFNKGVNFSVDPEFTHITPALLDRIWNQDNKMNALMWTMGNSGSIYGDVFVKIAYEPAWVDAIGKSHPGQVKIIPINPSFCFPEWHPQDKDRLIRFKLKYRFWTTSPEGTRIVCTYVEIIDDEWIEEYVNDELIDRRPNPMGFIPVVHIANKPVLASPWGLSDVLKIIDLNRRLNETATMVLDIVNYYTAPVTVVTGASMNNLEKGAAKVWAIRQKDAKVENLSGGMEGLEGALNMIDRLKNFMHELSGIPQSALGESQPVSNTSGVALSIQYLPTLMQYSLKKVQYGNGYVDISRMALQTLFVFEPDKLVYDPSTEGIMREGQPGRIDPDDPQVYNIEVIWPDPLPIDVLVKLNEIQLKMALGLESKKGALKELGEQFPDEKLQELFEEQVDDTKMQAAMRIINAHINAIIMAQTGIVPEGTEPVAPTKEGEQGPQAPALNNTMPGLPSPTDISAVMSDGGAQMYADLLTQAYGTKLPQRRIVDSNTNDQGIPA